MHYREVGLGLANPLKSVSAESPASVLLTACQCAFTSTIVKGGKKPGKMTEKTADSSKYTNVFNKVFCLK